jgi:glycosyltransferase involved in cell wall biosynthesis
LVSGLDPRFHVTHFGDPQDPVRDPASATILPAKAMGYAPGLWAKAKVLGTLVDPRHAGLGLHFFFTPNTLTSRVVASLRRIQGTRPMIQSLMSAHDVGRMVGLLKPLDRVIVLSDTTRRILLDAGLGEDAVVRIYPGVEPAEPVADPAGSRRILYAGDLDRAVAERIIDLARALADAFAQGWRLVLACRPKSATDAESRARVKSALAAELSQGQVQLLAEVEDMDGLLRSASLQVFLADHVHNKVDLPLVLLEGLVRGIGLVALDVAPVHEIFRVGRAQGLEPGQVVDEGDLGQAIARATGSPALIRQWGASARELANREFTAGRMVRGYEAVYDGLAREAGHR